MFWRHTMYSFSLMSFLEVSHVRFSTRQQYANTLSDNNVLFFHIFFHWFCGVLTSVVRGVKNYSISRLMGSYDIWLKGYLIYIYIYIYKGTTCLWWLMKRWFPSYTCLLCVIVYIVLDDWVMETISIYRVYTHLSWNWELDTDMAICA